MIRTNGLHFLKNRTIRVIVFAAFFVSCFAAVFLVHTPDAQASLAPCQCSRETHDGKCSGGDCTKAENEIDDDHNDDGVPHGEYDILIFIQEEFNAYRDWLTTRDTRGGRGVNISFFKGYFLPELMMMAEQISAAAMQQAFIVGTMFDAKHQLETQRTFQELQAKAQLDYQPSESFCRFGTVARSLAHSEQRGRLNAEGLNARQKARHLGSAIDYVSGTAGAYNRDGDRRARWDEFVTTYCDPEDNNYRGNSTGLVLACGGGGGRMNNDIDFSRTIELPRTLNVNFAEGSIDNGSSQGNHDQDEQDVMALSANLYGHNTLTRGVDSRYLDNQETQHLYLALRAVAAKRAVAENSYNAIIGLKSSGTTDAGEEGQQTRNFLGAVIRELGVTSNADIYELIGENPSYYAQLEILAKKIVQNTDFYTNLYDTPANIERKSVALKAIGLMLDRAIYESERRQELATSVLLATNLYNQDFDNINESMSNQDEN